MNGWKDQLVAVADDYGQGNISYDSIGNPTRYFGHTLEWGDVRRLKKFDNVSFTYNEKGVRTQKGDVFYSHIGNMITLEERYAFDSIAQEVLYTAILYRYGKTGVEGFSCNGQNYYFLKNLQGDVTHIYRQDGTLVGQYIYDAWGNFTIVTDVDGIATLNPIRYRSYYYDTETGLYYVKSRYYDPVVGRWINADNQLSTGNMTGMNLFAYCGNNPVDRIDPTGKAWWHWALGAAVVAACAVATVVTCGGFAAAATAVCMVSSGVAAATTASTIAAGAFIGSAIVYGMAALSAASTSSSVQEFNEQGNWGTVVATAFGGLTGGYDGYTMSKAQATQTVADDETFLPDSYYSKHAPKQSTPNSSYTNYTYNNYTVEYEKATAYYDFAGRQNIRIDWTNHGYSNHGNPHVHYTTYNSQYRDGFTIRWD